MPKFFDLIKNSLIFYKKNWSQISKYILMIVGISLALPLCQMVITDVLMDKGIAGERISAQTIITGLLIYLFFLVLTNLAIFWPTAGIIRMIDKKYHNQPEEKFWESLKNSKSFIWSMFLFGILQSLALFFGFLFLIVPSIIFGIWFMFGLQSIVLQGKKTLSAFGDSRELSRGRFFTVFGYMFLFGIILTTAIMIILMPQMILSGLSEKSYLISAISTIWTLVVVFFIAGFSFVFQNLFYQELKKNPLPIPPR